MKKKEKIIVFGASGFLGSFFCQLNNEIFDIISPSRKDVDVLNYQQCDEFIRAIPASVVINFVALANVNKCEEEKGNLAGLAYKLNAEVVKILSDICKKNDRHLIQLSTDCIFSGKKNNRPYNEEDQPNPSNWYGQTKYLGERLLQESNCSYCIARVEMAYTANLSFTVKQDFVRFFLSNLLANKKIKAIENQKITPTYIKDAAAALGLLVKSKAQGIFHIASTDWITPFDFAVKLAKEFNLNTNLIEPVKFGLLKNRSSRPRNPWLDVTKFQTRFGSGILHTNNESIKLFKKDFKL